MSYNDILFPRICLDGLITQIMNALTAPMSKSNVIVDEIISA